jgi:hypothetical protein
MTFVKMLGAKSGQTKFAEQHAESILGKSSFPMATKATQTP